MSIRVKLFHSRTQAALGTDQAFLLDCLRADAFAEGRATTAFLDESFPNGWQPDPLELLRLRGAAALYMARKGPSDPLQRRDGFRVMRERRQAWSDFFIADDFGEIDFGLEVGAASSAYAGSDRVNLSDVVPKIVELGEALHVSLKGLSSTVSVVSAAESRLGGARGGLSEGQIAAPLTGLVTCVHVAQGKSVEAGQPLVEMEAMKLVYTREVGLHAFRALCRRCPDRRAGRFGRGQGSCRARDGDLPFSRHRPGAPSRAFREVDRAEWSSFRRVRENLRS